MPEIGEVARIVHFIRQNLAGKTLAKVTAQVDENVYGKVGCSAEEFEKALAGKKVIDARQQGKYFWMVMSSPPHPLMHFGMAGWFHIRNMETAYYKPNASKNSEEWPPKYWKFNLATSDGPDKCEAAFVDFRRFARIRLIDCPADEIRHVSPLKENGPDPVQDKDIVTEEWLSKKLGSKHVPVKALLLDQANISGIGNWVGDEILYDAKIHPEQYSNTLSAAQIKQLHKSIQYVCGFAVDNLADKNKFPEHWLFNHRWTKGKKDSVSVLPNGSKFIFLTVGGRTSCVVPSVQKKTGPVAGDVKIKTKAEPDSDVDENTKNSTKKQGRGKKSAVKKDEDVKAEEEEEEEEEEEKKPAPKPKSTPRKADSQVAAAAEPTRTKKRKAEPVSSTAETNGAPKEKKKKAASEAPAAMAGRRRSGRVSGGGGGK